MRRLNFRAPWASCVICRGHLAWHDDAVCAQTGEYLKWIERLKR